jgi:hypothetical protein
VLLSGCEHRSHPWDQPDAAPSLSASTAPPGALAPPIALSRLDAGADAPGASGGAAPPEAPKPPVRVGGPWVRCYGGFHPSGDPLKDVTRLSMLCGPENGMRRLSTRALEGRVSAGGPGLSEAFEAHRGDCFRVFAAAEPSVADLDVVVRSSREAPIAADHGEGAWPIAIVQPDRPFCALEDDRYTFEVSAKKGSGRFAAEVWVLRASAPPRPGRAPSRDEP